jgi:hypothetical protein
MFLLHCAPGPCRYLDVIAYEKCVQHIHTMGCSYKVFEVTAYELGQIV